MLHNRLKLIREFHNLRQREVAVKLGVTREAYSMYESGRHQMSYENLSILADFYHLSVDYLLGRDQKEVFMCTSAEREHIERLRVVDERGRGTVRALLDLEVERAGLG
ncbi:MAG: helix-turn-helix domain-containing protein [Oscillospiraceae bacterium]|nr:helix-turn-helix domain-containing protein [Oscillospiraceae bacterium]